MNVRENLDKEVNDLRVKVEKIKALENNITHLEKKNLDNSTEIS
jgi:hypothetical protein